MVFITKPFVISYDHANELINFDVISDNKNITYISAANERVSKDIIKQYTIEPLSASQFTVVNHQLSLCFQNNPIAI